MNKWKEKIKNILEWLGFGALAAGIAGLVTGGILLAFFWILFVMAIVLSCLGFYGFLIYGLFVYMPKNFGHSWLENVFWICVILKLISSSIHVTRSKS